VWLAANWASRSKDESRIAALEAALQAAGASIGGSSDFPRQPAPDVAALAGIGPLIRWQRIRENARHGRCRSLSAERLASGRQCQRFHNR
jgi:hypothetical protein